MGKDFIAKIGYGPNGKTVMFDSHDAVTKFERLQKIKTDAVSEINSYYRQIEKDGRVYVFTTPARKADFEKSGKLGKGIIKIKCA